MHRRFLGIDLATTLLLLWLVGCAVFLVIDHQSPNFLQPFLTRQLLPSEDVI
jgi:hypothetical protein